MFLRRQRLTDNENDEALANLVGADDREALGILFDRYAHLLFGVGLKYLKNADKSKDTVMELFTDLPKLLATHDVQRFRPWVHTVMRNRCLQHFRKNGKVNMVDLDSSVELEDDAGLFIEAELREVELVRLEASIAELKDAQRECITLFYLKKQSYQRVAERTNFTIEQVRSHLQNGRAQFEDQHDTICRPALTY